ncbi:hypothetical protein CKAN_02760200 [Cinnamomum micranthum f. kanehirae]|uniref:Uncharacterized protein n=1 Tax=Cinnamomum micranthum f. kanehirae TaxID=337451 RepID=A0A443Q560_9MAGN|nr:hypothetical protein CKAN_02760200 [Cinnamomum micranthum f. kanehirae]
MMKNFTEICRHIERCEYPTAWIIDPAISCRPRDIAGYRAVKRLTSTSLEKSRRRRVLSKCREGRLISKAEESAHPLLLEKLGLLLPGPRSSASSACSSGPPLLPLGACLRLAATLRGRNRRRRVDSRRLGGARGLEGCPRCSFRHRAQLGLIVGSVVLDGLQESD